MNSQEKILELSRKRYIHINEREKSYDSEKGEYKNDCWEIIDHLGDQILELIKADHEELPFDFIIIELTKLGQCPSLLYDDDGRFAITGEGMQDVVMGESAQDLTMNHFILAKEWKNSPREALEYYLFSE